ncbi:MAG: glutamate racemase [Bdellovibrionales bacterium]
MIGVFDSGFGGLTVHKALLEALPKTDFVYLGDNRNAPYGTRPPLDVLTLTCVGVERLFAQGCQLVIIACNTASTVALHWIQDDWLPMQQRNDGIKRNVIGIVAPTIEAAVANNPETIGIFCTERTALTETYPSEIKKRLPDARVYQQACPELVRLIETGAADVDMRPLVEKYVAELHEQMGRTWPDRVILGCTHYALIRHLFTEALPKDITILDQQDMVGKATAIYMKNHPEYPSIESGKHRYLSTGTTPEALKFAERIMGKVTVENV